LNGDSPSVFIAIARPSADVFYALDLSNVPLGNDSCPVNLVEGSGTSISYHPTQIKFDCADSLVYASYDELGNPAATNIDQAASALPAFKVEVGEDGNLFLTHKQMEPGELRAAWES
jgi:hypothetical protein